MAVADLTRLAARLALRSQARGQYAMTVGMQLAGRFETQVLLFCLS